MDRFTEFIEKLKLFAENSDKIECVLIVGSYAKGSFTENSDLDIVIITPYKSEFIALLAFAGYFGTVIQSQTEYYGACTSVRVWYSSGLEVEFGFTLPSWIKIPLDAGTQRVLEDGYIIVTDKKGYFKKLMSVGRYQMFLNN